MTCAISTVWCGPQKALHEYMTQCMCLAVREEGILVKSLMLQLSLLVTYIAAFKHLNVCYLFLLHSSHLSYGARWCAEVKHSQTACGTRLCETKRVVCFAAVYCSLCVRVYVCLCAIDAFVQLSPRTQTRRKKHSGSYRSFCFVGIVYCKQVGGTTHSGLASRDLLGLESPLLLSTLGSF